MPLATIKINRSKETDAVQRELGSSCAANKPVDGFSSDHLKLNHIQRYGLIGLLSRKLHTSEACNYTDIVSELLRETLKRSSRLNNISSLLCICLSHQSFHPRSNLVFIR